MILADVCAGKWLKLSKISHWGQNAVVQQTNGTGSRAGKGLACIQKLKKVRKKTPIIP